MLISQVLVSSPRALEMVDQLLDITRVRLASGVRVVRQQMDKGFVVRQRVDGTRAAHPERTFTVDVSGDNEGRWDRLRIGQVLSNLLGTAVQYGFKDLPIRVSVESGTDKVAVSIHKDGVPIPPRPIVGI